MESGAEEDSAPSEDGVADDDSGSEAASGDGDAPSEGSVGVFKMPPSFMTVPLSLTLGIAG